MFKYRGVRGLLDAKIYAKNERVGQLIILPYPQIELIESDILSETERGDSGFGSTGK
jgi:dUTP pyrophosphatase